MIVNLSEVEIVEALVLRQNTFKVNNKTQERTT